jgi:predicted AAA+ superfamily ATPase
MRDLTRIRDLDLVEALMDILPWRVGTPFSTNAVREDLEVAQATVKGMMDHLERLMFTFSISPYTEKVSRPVKKERKVYLFDWSSIENPGGRFENLVAVELYALTRLWTESGGDEWNLRFIRNREGKETDFLVLRKRKPWCLLECKIQRSKVESHHLLFARKLGNLPVVQLLKEHGALHAKDRDVVSVSASRFVA